VDQVDKPNFSLGDPIYHRCYVGCTLVREGKKAVAEAAQTLPRRPLTLFSIHGKLAEPKKLLGGERLMSNCDYTMKQHLTTLISGGAVFPLSECAC
jgi:hypothetical protein